MFEMECTVQIIAPANLSSVQSGLLLLQICASCNPGFSFSGDLSVYLNGKVTGLQHLAQSTGGGLMCNHLLEARITLDPKDEVQSLRAVVTVAKDGQAGLSHAVTEPIFLKIRKTFLKRFLFMLHMSSLWRLMELKRNLLTQDSDVVTLICPTAMSPEEEAAYNADEEIAAEQFGACSLHSFDHCVHPKFGKLIWFRNCSRNKAQAILFSESLYRTPYSFYVFLEDDNLVSIPLIFEENYIKASHRRFMAQFSMFCAHNRLKAPATLIEGIENPDGQSIQKIEDVISPGQAEIRYKQIHPTDWISDLEPTTGTCRRKRFIYLIVSPSVTAAAALERAAMERDSDVLHCELGGRAYARMKRKASVTKT